jgi:hypothetical protein
LFFFKLCLAEFFGDFVIVDLLRNNESFIKVKSSLRTIQDSKATITKSLDKVQKLLLKNIFKNLLKLMFEN